MSGTLTAIAGFLTLNQWAILIGVVATVLTTAVNVWSRVAQVRSQKNMEADQREHHRRIRRIKRDQDPDESG